jgi:perosamine synthetase
MNDFIPQFVPQIRPKDIEAVEKQMRSGWVGCGEKTLEFEEKIAKISRTKHCVSTTSGTTAIMLAIKSLNLPRESTILFPSYTFLAGANACKFLGYNIQLVDISMETLCMNPYAMDRKFLSNKNISCVLFVNHNAFCGGREIMMGREDVFEVKRKCNINNIPIVEDSSQALGISGAGRTGDLGIFSFSVPKLVTTGQGGAVVTNDDELAGRCKELRDHGDNNWRKTRIHTEIGGNFKFNDILAAYGLSQLEDLDELLAQRKFIFDKYRNHLELMDYGYDSTWMVLYKTKFAEKIINALKQEKIQAVQYYRPVNHNPTFSDNNTYLCAEEIYETVLYLPSSLSLTIEQIDRICKIVIDVERKCFR